MTTEISLFILQTEVVMMMVKLKTFNTPGHCEKVTTLNPHKQVKSFLSFG